MEPPAQDPPVLEVIEDQDDDEAPGEDRARGSGAVEAAVESPEPVISTPEPEVVEEPVAGRDHSRPMMLAPPAPDGTTAVRVFFGTDRERTRDRSPNGMYGDDSAERLELGIAQISIPPDHRTGKVERPRIWRLEFREDPEKHVVLDSVRPRRKQAWLRELRATGARSAFIFVHGFHNTFAEAARRSGQMGYDLEYDGLPMFYSWASAGTVVGYERDGREIQLAVPHFRRFLELAAQEGGLAEVNIVAHSMGNRLVTEALRQMDGASGAPFRIAQLVLAAPDIDAGWFREELLGVLPRMARRVTLYASSRDPALAASRLLNHGPRAGDVDGGLLGAPGIDGIDASDVPTEIDRHRYFAEDMSILTDIHCLLEEGTPPERRPVLDPRIEGGRRWWHVISQETFERGGIDPTRCAR